MVPLPARRRAVGAGSAGWVCSCHRDHRVLGACSSATRRVVRRRVPRCPIARPPPMTGPTHAPTPTACAALTCASKRCRRRVVVWGAMVCGVLLPLLAFALQHLTPPLCRCTLLLYARAQCLLLLQPLPHVLQLRSQVPHLLLPGLHLRHGLGCLAPHVAVLSCEAPKVQLVAAPLPLLHRHRRLRLRQLALQPHSGVPVLARLLLRGRHLPLQRLDLRPTRAHLLALPCAAVQHTPPHHDVNDVCMYARHTTGGGGRGHEAEV